MSSRGIILRGCNRFWRPTKFHPPIGELGGIFLNDPRLECKYSRILRNLHYDVYLSVALLERGWIRGRGSRLKRNVTGEGYTFLFRAFCVVGEVETFPCAGDSFMRKV